MLGFRKKITALLEGESDRGAILILAAYLEEILGLIIRAACTTEKHGDELLEFRGPGGSFSSKIQLCEAFGLINPNEVSALNCLRKIRNNAAHFDQKGRGFDVLFDSKQTLDQLRAFLGHLNLTLESEDPEHARSIFTTAARLLASKLMMRGFLVVRAKVPKSIKELAQEFKLQMKDTPVGKAIKAAEDAGGDEGLSQLMALMQARIQNLIPPSDGKIPLRKK